MWVDRRGYPR